MNQIQQYYKLGDIVETRKRHRYSKYDRGVIAEEFGYALNHDIRCYYHKIIYDWQYSVYWFTKWRYLTDQREIKRCEGLKNKQVCKSCQYEGICEHLSVMAKCRFSDIGDRHGELGKNTELCDKCTARYSCFANDWTENRRGIE